MGRFSGASRAVRTSCCGSGRFWMRPLLLQVTLRYINWDVGTAPWVTCQWRHLWVPAETCKDCCLRAGAVSGFPSTEPCMWLFLANYVQTPSSYSNIFMLPFPSLISYLSFLPHYSAAFISSAPFKGLPSFYSFPFGLLQIQQYIAPYKSECVYNIRFLSSFFLLLVNFRFTQFVTYMLCARANKYNGEWCLLGCYAVWLL
jgi:hypothetical protein